MFLGSSWHGALLLGLTEMSWCIENREIYLSIKLHLGLDVLPNLTEKELS